MYSRLLSVFFIIFLFQQIRANEHPLNTSMNWEHQLRELNFELKKNSLPTKQAAILKTFHNTLLKDINNTKSMNSPLFEKKISLLNRMNALFLDNFKKQNCSNLKIKWELLKSTEPKMTFELQQVDTWLDWICR